jgi:hypothetical protein
MRAWLLFALILTSLTLAVSAQEYKTPKAKPYYSESRRSEEKQSKGVAADKKLTPQTSNSQELRRVEQQTAKSVSSKAAKQRPHSARVVKTEREKPNPPIRFSSAGGGKTSMNDQGKNPYKGRVRQKGNGSH